MNRARKSTTQQIKERLDGWVNALTGIGAALRDKRMSTTFVPDVLSREQLENIWRGDDMAARIVETIPNEMLREGFEIGVQGEDGVSAKDVSEALDARLDELNVHGSFLDALNYERAYGGSGILIGADDGERDLRQPLREDRIKSLDWLTVLAAHELYPTSYYTNPQAPKFGEVMTYRIQADTPTATAGVASMIEVHESRLIRFRGIRVSKRQMLNNIAPGWGDSVLVRCNRILSDFHQSWSSAGILLQDFAQAILKVKDLADLIATNQDDVIIKRAQILDMSRSVARMTLIDSEEDFERKATPMTGLPEMLQQLSLRLAAAADMPVTLLLGQAPAGLNATGESDIRFFYDRVRARQRTHLQPALSRLVKLVMLAKNGPTKGREPKNWIITFNRLWQLSDPEKADIRLKTSQADASDIMAGVLSPAEVAISRYGGDRYSTETVLDLEGRAAMASAPKRAEPEPNDKKPRADGQVVIKPASKYMPVIPARKDARGIVHAWAVPRIEHGVRVRDALTVKEYETREIAGLIVVIDRPKGTVQRGTSADGTPWSREYLVDYGYFYGTAASDGEGVDVYIGPMLDAPQVHIIDQLTPSGEFDEPKVMYGFADQATAIEMFLKHMPAWALGTVKSYNPASFIEWLGTYAEVRDTTTGKPLWPAYQILYAEAGAL